jgi:hypothetical protein
VGGGFPGLGAQLRQHLVVLREAPGVVLRVDLLAVPVDVEDAAAALDELRLDAELVANSGRQTGGLG